MHTPVSVALLVIGQTLTPLQIELHRAELSGSERQLRAQLSQQLEQQQQLQQELEQARLSWTAEAQQLKQAQSEAVSCVVCSQQLSAASFSRQALSLQFTSTEQHAVWRSTAAAHVCGHCITVAGAQPEGNS